MFDAYAALHASSANRTQNPPRPYIAALTAADAIALVPCALPGIPAGRMHSIAFDMENPQIPTGVSFFNQQATTS